MFGWGKKERDRKKQKVTESRNQAYGIPTVKVDPARVTETIREDLRNNIKSLREVSVEDFNMVYDAAIRSISAGRAADIIYQALMNIDGISTRRAEDIARSLNNKADVLIAIERQEQIGIKYAIWRYSGAMCGNAEQDASHKAADGNIYLIKKGIFMNGRWMWPGREDGCKCVSRALIHGIHYTGEKPEGYVK
jgi:uncharacterized protein with gpF-like domain